MQKAENLTFSVRAPGVVIARPKDGTFKDAYRHWAMLCSTSKEHREMYPRQVYVVVTPPTGAFSTMKVWHFADYQDAKNEVIAHWESLPDVIKM